MTQTNVKFYREKVKPKNCFAVFCTDTWTWQRNSLNGNLSCYGVTGSPYVDSSHLGHFELTPVYITNNRLAPISPDKVFEYHPTLLKFMTALYGELEEIRPNRWAFIGEEDDQTIMP